jgi:DNA polymerase-3 subunit alpha (Gram-positive type)
MHTPIYRLPHALALLGIFLLASTAPARTNLNPVLRDQVFVVFDVETTGLSPANERILELGAVKIRNGRITATAEWLINPRKRIHPGARRVHGITYSMIKNQRTFKHRYPEIQAFIGDAVLIAHNARFDRDFLYAEVERAGLPRPTNEILDSLRLFRAWYPDAPSHQLGVLTQFLNIRTGDFHRGLADSVYAAKIFQHGMAQPGAPQTLDALLEIGRLP